MAGTTDTRPFIKILGKSYLKVKEKYFNINFAEYFHIQDDALKDLCLYLQSEQECPNGLIHSLEEGREREEKILSMEEKLLFNLVQYLQAVGFIETNKKDSSDTATAKDK